MEKKDWKKLPPMLELAEKTCYWHDDVKCPDHCDCEICGHQPGPDYEPSDFDPSSSSDNENDPAYIKGSTYEIRISQAD